MAPTFRSLLVTLVLIVVVSIPIAVQALVGDWRQLPIDELKSPEVVWLAKFALKEHDKKANTTLQFVDVIQGIQRITMIYKLKISARDGNATKIYVAMIHHRPWIKKNHTSLMSFTEIKGYPKGWWPIDDLKDEWVLMSAKFGVAEHNKKANTTLRFVNVVRGEEKPYGRGKYDYNMVISAKDNNSATAHQEDYQVFVSLRVTPSKKVMNLRSFKKI